MVKKLIANGIVNDLSIAVTQGICFRGILSSKHRMEFRTIGQCISDAGAISALPMCKKTLLIDDDTVTGYLDATECDFFISNEAFLGSNAYIFPQMNTKNVSVILHELVGVSNSISYFKSTGKDSKIGFLENIDKNPLCSKWQTLIKSFLEDGKPNPILLKGSPGNNIILTSRKWKIKDIIEF